MKYTVYKFPSLHGTPRHFRFYMAALFYGLRMSSRGCTIALRNNATGEYRAYWL